MSNDSSKSVPKLPSAREIIKHQAFRRLHVFHISTEEDLLFAEQHIKPAYFNVIRNWFDELRSVSPMEVQGIPFSLESGCIHAIETAEKIPDSLAASWIDYSQLLKTDESGFEVWKIVSVEDDFVDTWFAPKEMLADLDALAERYLEQDQT